MASEHMATINRFFDAYSRHDLDALMEVASEHMRWIFPGENPLSGTKMGIDAVISFFDTMGEIMEQSNVNVEKLVMGENHDFVIECQHVWTNREDGINLDHQWCVLWEFEEGRFIGGKHFSEDQKAVDAFFNRVMK